MASYVDSTYNESIGKNLPDSYQYNFKSMQLKIGKIPSGSGTTPIALP